VSGNKFLANRAIDLSEKTGVGGAILFECDPTKISFSCTVALLNNTFTGNQANRKGGALRYENDKFSDAPLLDRSFRIHAENRLLQAPAVAQAAANIFKDNEAPYGADMASFPKSIRFVVPESYSGARIDLERLTLTLAAGQSFKFELSILDQEGRVYNDENEATAKIDF